MEMLKYRLSKWLELNYYSWCLFRSITLCCVLNVFQKWNYPNLCGGITHTHQEALTVWKGLSADPRCSFLLLAFPLLTRTKILHGKIQSLNILFYASSQGRGHLGDVYYDKPLFVQTFQAQRLYRYLIMKIQDRIWRYIQICPVYSLSQ